jgi:hypothetical protein
MMTSYLGMIMYARIGTVLLLLLMTGTVALAASKRKAPESSPGILQGTQDEQDACGPDAARFCEKEIPDTFAVLACLQAHRKRLSKACRHVLESNGQ